MLILCQFSQNKWLIHYIVGGDIMKVEILYDEYSNKIDTAKLMFGEDIEQQLIKLEVMKTVEGEEDAQTTIDIVKLTSIDKNTIEIENELNKEDLRVLLTLLRNLLNQL